MPEIDYLKAMKDKEYDEQALTDRQDNDIKLINVVDRVLRDTADKPKKIPNSLFVPLNDLLVFVTTVKAYLGDAQEQVEVTSEDENLDTAEIESFIRAFWKEVDNRWRKGKGTGGKQRTFSPFIYEQTVERGRVAVPSLCRIENGELVADLRCWDSRFVRSVTDKWMGYLMTRSSAAIKLEYPDLLSLPDKELLSVRSILTPEDEIIYVEDVEALRIPHPYKEVPGVVGIVPLGSMRADADSLQYEGESILLMVRDIFPELMRYASIIQSLNMKELDHALQEKVDREDMDGSPPPEHDKLTDPRSVIKTIGGFTPMPLGELRAMASRLENMLESRMQRGGINNFDMGVFNQAMSAVALIRIGQGRDKVYNPRLGTHGLAKQDLTAMAIKQILQEAEEKKVRSLKIGRQTYDLAILKEEYDIEFKYSIKDTTIEAARQSMAVSQRGLIPRISILRDTLGREDPEGDLRELYSEEAELLFPNIKRKRILKALYEKAKKGDDDAQDDLDLGLAELGITIDQLFSGQSPPAKPPEEVKPEQPMVPLFDEGRGAANKTILGVE